MDIAEHDNDIRSFISLTDKVRRQIAREAIAWWDSRGRHLVPRRFNQMDDPAAPLRVETGGKGPAMIFKPNRVDDLPGILRGDPWDILDDVDRTSVVKQYYRCIWMPAHMPDIKPAGTVVQ